MAIFHFFLLCVFLANWSAASEINNCLPNPCLNNGRCVDGDDRYTCSCTYPFTGLNCNDTCLAPWAPFNGSCYWFVAVPVVWRSAQNQCAYWGGTLVEITSAEENTFLVSLRDKYPDYEWHQNTFPKEKNTWIGLKYQAMERNYVWDSSGKLAYFTNWENGQQSNVPFEDCVEMLKGGEWTRSFCHYLRYYFCQRPVKEFRYCSLEPCRNGGTCTEVENYYRCSCRPEFIGPTCEEFNNCFPNPCLNGGTCEDRDNGHTCICTPEFTGYYCRNTCPAGWTTFDKRCYSLNISPVNWFSGQSLCKNRGSDLAEITSAALNEFLVHLQNKADVGSAWIGLNDQGNGTYFWVSSGKNAKFTNWYNDQPRDTSSVKDCVVLWHDHGAWKKMDCGSSRSYFCERPLFELCPALDLSERSCYRVGTSSTDWSTAQTSCLKDGGHLVEVNSAAENAYLVDLMEMYSIVKSWIGLKVEGNKGPDIWDSSGDVANFTNWEDDRSSDLSLMNLCVVMILQSGTWKNVDCEGNARFICEYSKQSIHCFSDPCLNGGTCTGLKDNYTCSCRPNFYGRNCEEFNSCSSNPCKNGGTCVDGDNYYICNCADGFTGGNCMGRCPAEWTPFENICYNFTASPLDWTSAEASCRNRGGNLAQITSTAENDFLIHIRDEVAGHDAWIGLRKREYENTFTWNSSRNVANFTNWANNKPSGAEGCVEMWWSGMWNDLKCGSNRSYFCERSVIESG